MMSWIARPHRISGISGPKPALKKKQGINYKINKIHFSFSCLIYDLKFLWYQFLQTVFPNICHFLSCKTRIACDAFTQFTPSPQYCFFLHHYHPEKFQLSVYLCVECTFMTFYTF